MPLLLLMQTCYCEKQLPELKAAVTAVCDKVSVISTSLKDQELKIGKIYSILKQQRRSIGACASTPTSADGPTLTPEATEEEDRQYISVSALVSIIVSILVVESNPIG
jgi:hypothetical protein